MTGRQTWRGQYLGEGIYEAGEEIRHEYGKPHQGPYGTTYVILTYVCGKGESSCTRHLKVVRTSPGAVMHTHTYTIGSVVLVRNQGALGAPAQLPCLSWTDLWRAAPGRESEAKVTNSAMSDQLIAVPWGAVRKD